MTRRILRHILFAIAFLSMNAASAQAVLHHVHGLAFTPDGKALMVPAHVGLAIYRDGRWTTAPGDLHDFMGFSVTKSAIYTSGHPAPSSPLKNPLGLMKSVDGGKSWRQLGLSGESDFHVMAAGYGSGAVYVINPEPNSQMRSEGLHVTVDDGKSWKRTAGSGLSGQITSLAAHPAVAGTVAVGASTGLYVSRDHGATFKRVGLPAVVTGVSFDFDGKHVYFATDAAKLHRLALDGSQPAPLSLPPLERDFVLYVAQNPRDTKELAVATRRRDVYVSRDGGAEWQQIARAGEAVGRRTNERASSRKAPGT